MPALQLSQTPFVQPPTVHIWHASPPAPQAASLVPGRQVVPEQQPVLQLVPSHTQAPFRQRWPLAQAAPVPQTQVPAAEQPSAASASQTLHAAPGAPHASTARGLQIPPAQQPSIQVVASHLTVVSRWQVSEQPSPETVLWSSQSSMPSRTTPSPQIAGAPSVSVRPTISPACATTIC